MTGLVSSLSRDSKRPPLSAYVAAHRIPQTDWTKFFDRHWNLDNPVMAHAFNALSFLLPQGEKFFADVAHEVASVAKPACDSAFGASLRSFVAQEVAHSFQHGQYNAVVRSHGFENAAHRFVECLITYSHRNTSPLTKLAEVCAYEHYTAVLGDFILSNPEVFSKADPDFALLWGWHAAEETEHKSFCFDLYRNAGGGWLRRVAGFILVTVNFSIMFGINLVSALSKDGCLDAHRLPHTLRHAATFFFGKTGLAWRFIGHGIRYLGPNFHPWNHDNRDKMGVWLAMNRQRLCRAGGVTTAVFKNTSPSWSCP